MDFSLTVNPSKANSLIFVVTSGPRLFLSCPMDVEGSRVWFTDLWNYSLVPYLLEAVREGLQVSLDHINGIKRLIWRAFLTRTLFLKTVFPNLFTFRSQSAGLCHQLKVYNKEKKEITVFTYQSMNTMCRHQSNSTESTIILCTFICTLSIIYRN